MRRGFLIWIACLAAAPLLAGCAAAPTMNAGSGPSAGGTSATASNRVVVPADAEAFATLEKVAPASLKLEGGAVTSTACWTPSEHLFQDPAVATPGTWKVLCRVYYVLNASARYQDATCIGDFDATPMLDHCYVWEYYTYEPRFSDGDRLASPPPSPAP